MTQVAWLTDIHLNFLRVEQLQMFVAELAANPADAVLIGGDIGEADSVVLFLELLAGQLERPIFFVLGNHDFYRGSIAEVRSQVAALCDSRPNLNYLSTSDPIELAAGVGLVGHDGWADGRLGDYDRSPILMADHELIAELIPGGKQGRLPVLQQLGDQAAAHIERVLPAALERYEHVVLLTHVPPLREACWHEGRLSDDDWAPHFTCKAMGDAILRIMRDHPDRRLTVLCGHTHGRGTCRPAANVEILTGGAEYGSPAVERVFEFGS